MKFPIGGIVRERLGADLVQLQNQQYSLDERRRITYIFCDTHAPEACIPGLFLKTFLDFLIGKEF